MPIVVEFTSDEAKLIQGLMRMAAAAKQTEAAFEGAGKSSGAAMERRTGAVSAEVAMAREATRAWEAMATPMERHNAQLATYQKYLDAGVWSAAKFRQAKDRAIAQFTAPARAKQQADEDKATAKAEADKAKAERDKQAAEQRAAGIRKSLWAESATALERYNERMRELKKHLADGVIGEEQFRRSAKHAGDELERQNSAGQSFFGQSTLAKMGAMAAGYLSISKAIDLVNQSLAHQRQVAKEAHDFAVSVADPQAEALLNLSAKSDEAQAAAIKNVQQMAAELKPGGGEATAWKVFSAALSGSGGNEKIATEAAKTAMRIAPTNEATMTQMAAVLPDVGQFTGAKTGSEQLGYMIAIGNQAVSTSQQQVSSYLVPAAKQLTAYGATPEEAAAFVTATQKAVGQRDVEGRLTASGLTNLASELEKALPTETRYNYSPEGKRTLAAKGTRLKTFTERVKYLQTNQKARERFLSEASFETSTRVALEELLGAREGRTKQYFEENFSDFTKRDQWGKLGEDMIERMKKPREQRVAGANRAAGATKEELQRSLLGQVQQMEAALSGEKIDELTTSAGQGYVQSKVGKLVYDAAEFNGTTAEERFRAAGMRQVEQLRTDRREKILSSGYGHAQSMEVVTPTKDPLKLQAAEILERGIEKQIEEFRKLRKEYEENRKVLEKQLAEQEKQRISSGAANANLRQNNEPAPAGI